MTETERAALDTLERLRAELLDLAQRVGEMVGEVDMARAGLGAHPHRDDDPLTDEDWAAVQEARAAVASGDYVDERWVAERLARGHKARA
jgi:hypothetical protein